MKDKAKKNIRSTNWLTKDMTQEEIKKRKEDAIREADIELMAREIAERDCYLYDKCPKEHKHNCVSQDPEIMLESSKNYITIATWLVNANYQKVDKDSVVLTKTEKEKLLHEMYEQGRFDALADLEKEGKVVITKEEYEKLLKIKEQSSIKEINYFSNLFKLQKELEQVEKERDSARDNCDRKSKEMVEKILKKLKLKFREQEERFANENHRLEEKLPNLKYERDIPIVKEQADKASGQATMAEKAQGYIDELTKQFNIEIKDN